MASEAIGITEGGFLDEVSQGLAVQSGKREPFFDHTGLQT